MNDEPVEQYTMADPRSHTDADRAYALGMREYFDHSPGTSLDKLKNFAKFVPRQALSVFLAKNEIFRRIVNVHGHVVECGVFLGGGLMTWAQLSAIHEPINHCRRVEGFDTFEGFTDFKEQDQGDAPEYAHVGGLASGAEKDLAECIALYDTNRPLGHIQRVELVAGDATETIPAFLENHSHLVVALLYLDFDLYEPTRVAIETFLPRMPKGAVLAFDELNQRQWPGETLAALEAVGLRNLRLERFPYVPQLSFAVLD